MDVLAQLLTGLAGASSLFLVAAGLTVIFGATCVVAVNMINRGERGHTYQQAVLVLSRATGVRMVPVYV